MATTPEIRFLSLFVDDLEEAARRYAAFLGVAATRTDPDVPSRHPFAKAGPIVFDLGRVKLALYQADQSGTHQGDVGIGVQVAGSPQPLAERASQQGGQPFYGPAPIAGAQADLVVLMMPDRHFFEVVGKR